jgi:hypothetical protein
MKVMDRITRDSRAGGIVGLILLVSGAALFVAMARGNSWIGLLAAPALIASGIVLLARALWPHTPLVRDAPVLSVGLVMLLIGGFPWLYTPYLTGDRPGGESAGMLGTLLFLTAGLPGLLITVSAGLMRMLRG